MKESKFSIEPNRCIFRFTGNSEQECRKQGGVPTDVTFSDGVASFNGTSSFVTYSESFSGIIERTTSFSFRFKFNSNESVNDSRFLIVDKASNNALQFSISGNVFNV